MKVSKPVYDEEIDESLAEQESYEAKFKYKMNGEYTTKVIVVNEEDKFDAEFEIF